MGMLSLKWPGLHVLSATFLCMNNHIWWLLCLMFSKKWDYNMCLLTWKIFTALKLRAIFHLAGIFRTSHLEVSISSNPERIASRRQGEEPGYTEVLHQRADSLNVKGLLLKKTRYLKELGTFLCIGRWKSLGSLKSFHWYAPPLSGANIPCFHILHFLRAHCGEWLQSAAGGGGAAAAAKSRYSCWTLCNPIDSSLPG